MPPKSRLASPDEKLAPSRALCRSSALLSLFARPAEEGRPVFGFKSSFSAKKIRKRLHFRQVTGWARLARPNFFDFRSNFRVLRHFWSNFGLWSVGVVGWCGVGFIPVRSFITGRKVGYTVSLASSLVFHRQNEAGLRLAGDGDKTYGVQVWSNNIDELYLFCFLSMWIRMIEKTCLTARIESDKNLCAVLLQTCAICSPENGDCNFDVSSVDNNKAL